MCFVYTSPPLASVDAVVQAICHVSVNDMNVLAPGPGSYGAIACRGPAFEESVYGDEHRGQDGLSWGAIVVPSKSDCMRFARSVAEHGLEGSWSPWRSHRCIWQTPCNIPCHENQSYDEAGGYYYKAGDNGSYDLARYGSEQTYPKIDTTD